MYFMSRRKEKFYRSFTAVDGKKFQVSYFRIDGARPGPTLTLIAGQHGMEHSGPVLLSELIDELNPDEFSGTLLICPCANPAALALDYEIYPETEDLSKLDNYFYSEFRHGHCVFGLARGEAETCYNMNRLWNRPGKPLGMAGEITAWLWDEICRPANVIIDMHCLQADKPQIFVGDPVNFEIAKHFGIECVYRLNPNPDAYQSHNLLYQVTMGLGIRGFCVEFSRQHGLKESEYELGKRGVRNVMKAMGMLSGEVVHQRPVWAVLQEDIQHFHAKTSGHIRYCFNEYDQIRKGDRLYYVRDIQTLEVVEEFLSPIDGVFCGHESHPLAAPGRMTCWIAPAQPLANNPTNTPTSPCLDGLGISRSACGGAI